MFERCVSLISLDLSSFDTSKVQEMKYMFQSCYSLIYLNLISFHDSTGYPIYMLEGVRPNLILCLNETRARVIKYYNGN